MMRIVTILESNNMTIKEGDTKDIFKLGLSYADGTKPILDGASVNLFIANEEGVVVTKEMTVEGEGEVSFELTNEDITGTGHFDAEIIIIYPDGKRETFPDDKYFSFKVMPSIENRGNITFIDHYELIITRVEQLMQEIEDAVEQAKEELVNGTHYHTLNDLSNVEIQTASLGEVLTFNGTNWVNGAGALQYILITEEEENYLLGILDRI